MRGLPDFGALGSGEPASEEPVRFLGQRALAQQLAAAHAAGLEAGRAAARAEATATLGAAAAGIARQLQAANFTYFEARRAVILSLEDLVTGLVDILLPGILTEAIGEMLAAHVSAAAREATDHGVQLMCHPTAAERLEAVLAHLPQNADKVILRPDTSMKSDSVRIIADSAETRIDTETALARIREGVAAFYRLEKEENLHASA